ncbi:MAG: BspA family leucine-rich repeat surface protein, partial [Lachnospiraceae bacterium]|nr:BspA family leucine-rich repeat surface protein [Lachnospiraceae bacterium]
IETIDETTEAETTKEESTDETTETTVEEITVTEAAKPIEEIEASESETTRVETEEVAEATNSEIVEEEKLIVEASESEVEKFGVASESDAEVEIASDSELEEIVTATESEATIATDSNAEKSTISEISTATKSILVVATIPIVSWKIEKIYIATHSEIDYLAYDDTKPATKNNLDVENKLAKNARVLVSNNLGEKKIITVNLKWKLQKSVKIATRAAARTMPFRKEKWQQDLSMGSFISDEEKAVFANKATSDEIQLTEDLIEEAKNEHGEEVVVVINKTTASLATNKLKIEKTTYEIIDNKNTQETNENKETELDNETLKSEDIEKSIDGKSILETSESVEINETNEFVVESEIVEPTVAGFVDTENTDESETKQTETSDNETSETGETDEEKTEIETEVETEVETETETETDETFETYADEVVETEDNDETKETEEAVNATLSETTETYETIDDLLSDVVIEDVTTDATLASTSQITFDDSKLYKSAAVETDETLNGIYDLAELDLYTPDMEYITKQVLDNLNNKNTNSNDNSEEEVKNEDIGIFGAIGGFFSGLFGNNEEESEEDIETTDSDELDAEATEEDIYDYDDLSEIDLDDIEVDLSEVVNEVNSEGVELPEVSVNGFGLFGAGFDQPHVVPSRAIRHPICGFAEAIDGTTCSGHSIDGSEFKHTIFSDADLEYKGIEVRIPALAAKNGATVSIAKSMAVAIFADAGKENYTFNNRLQIQSGVNLYICTNGIDIVFGEQSKIFGQGNVYLCNCLEKDGDNENITHITTVNEFRYLDQFGVKWPDRLARIVNREDPLFDCNSVYVYGTNMANRCNMVFEDIKIRGNFRNKVAAPFMMDTVTIKEWSQAQPYGSVINANSNLHVFNVDFRNIIATRANGILNGGTGNNYIQDVNMENTSVTENGGAICIGSNVDTTTKTANVRIMNCGFKNTYAGANGGAIFFYNESYGTSTKLKVKGCTFDGSTAEQNGGAIAINGCSKVELISNEFVNNVAKKSGGALAIHENRYLVSNVYIKKDNESDKKTIFENNTAKDSGGAISINTIYYDNETKGSIGPKAGKKAVLEIAATDFKDNKASGIEYTYNSRNYTYNSYGGAIYSKGYVDLKVGYDSANTTNKNMCYVSFDGNTASNGGALTAGRYAVFDQTMKNIEAIDGNANTATFYYGEMKNNGVANANKSGSDAWKYVAWGGGAIYAMQKADVTISENFEIANNDDAVYACGATINTKAKMTQNTGRYVFGYSNNKENKITFNDGTNITNNFLEKGESKDYTEYYTAGNTSEAKASIVINNSAIMCTGQNFNVNIKKLLGYTSPAYNTDDTKLTAIKWTQTLPTTAVTGTELNPNVNLTGDSYGQSVTIKSGNTYSPNAVLAWLSGTTIYLYSKSKVNVQNGDVSYMFYGFKSLTSIDFGNFDAVTIPWTSMAYMFRGCSSLTSIDLSCIEFKKAPTNINYLFSQCTALKSVNIKNLITKSVSAGVTTDTTSMQGLFYNCTAIEEVDLSNFDTSGTTNMSYMFYNCKALKKVNLTSFDTSKVTTFLQMFINCESLTGLDLTNFNTSKATTVDSMFKGCVALQSLDLSSWNLSITADRTSLVSNSLFADCKNLVRVYVPHNFIIGGTGTGLFTNCSKIKGGNGTAYDSTKTDLTYAVSYEENDIGVGYMTAVEPPNREQVIPASPVVNPVQPNSSNYDSYNWSFANKRYKTTTISFNGAVNIDNNYWSSSADPKKERNIKYKPRNMVFEISSNYKLATDCNVGIFVDQPETLIYDKWSANNTSLVGKYNNGVTFSDYFTADANVSGGDFEGYQIYRDNENMYLGKQWVEVAFDFGITGAPKNPRSQYIYGNAIRTFIDKPFELTDKKYYSVASLSFLGFIGRDSQSPLEASTLGAKNRVVYYEGAYIDNYQLVDFDYFRLNAADAKNKKITLYGIYAYEENGVSTKKIRTCGVPANQNCNHAGIIGNHAIMDGSDPAHRFIKVEHVEQFLYVEMAYRDLSADEPSKNYAAYRPGYSVEKDIVIPEGYGAAISEGSIIHLNGNSITNAASKSTILNTHDKLGSKTRLLVPINCVYEDAQINVTSLIEEDTGNYLYTRF